MTANAYPGNPSLSDEVKQRVLATFNQTLSLFDEAQLDEVVAGCDLILEMDDRFEPAKKLRQKAKDPTAPIDMAELYRLRDGDPSSGDDSANEARMLEALEEFNNGNYESTIELCNEILRSDPSNEEAQTVGQQASERLEAAPFIAQFLQEADNAIDAGNRDAGRSLIEKARALDPLHPDIAAMENRLETAPAAPAAPASSAEGFDFGTGHSPFAGAFGAPVTPEPEGGGGAESGFGFVQDVIPEPASEEPAAAEMEDEPQEPAQFDFGAPASEEPAPVDFGTPQTDSPSDSTTEAPSPEGEAASFGFTLEEAPEAPAVKSPEPAAEPSIAEPSIAEGISLGDAQTFDFSTTEVEVSDADQQKIDRYLAEGDSLFESGNYQGAIDSWSKIFLIDVTNEQASERIEQAKEKKREEDQKLDSLLTTGIAAYDRGDYPTARETFEEVLAQDPENFRASEYLEKLADHAAATAAPEGSSAAPVASEPSFDETGDLYGGGDVYTEEAVAPPPPPAAIPKAAAQKPKGARKSPKTMIIAVVAVVVLAVGGWFAWSMLGGGEDQAVNSSVTLGKINRAQVLAGEGDYTQAIDILSTVEAGDPMREQALQLIAQYRRQQAQSAGTVGGRPMNEVRNELLDQARQAFAAEDYLAAKSAFEEAAKLKALDQVDREMYDAASHQVSKLETATTLFAQGSYREAIEDLSSILEEEPDNVNAREMLVDAHYNLGVQALKNQNIEQAIEQFGTVLQQNPNDEMARRSMEIAQLYQDRTRDLMYEIYVKYLPLR